MTGISRPSRRLAGARRWWKHASGENQSVRNISQIVRFAQGRANSRFGVAIAGRRHHHLAVVGGTKRFVAAHHSPSSNQTDSGLSASMFHTRPRGRGLLATPDVHERMLRDASHQAGSSSWGPGCVKCRAVAVEIEDTYSAPSASRPQGGTAARSPGTMPTRRRTFVIPCTRTTTRGCCGSKLEGAARGAVLSRPTVDLAGVLLGEAASLRPVRVLSQ